MPAASENIHELASTAPASMLLPSAKRRAASACVPTEMALSEPPNIHSSSRHGSSAACANDESGQPSQAKKMMSTSLTALCASIASTVGSASFKTMRGLDPERSSGAADELGGRATDGWVVRTPGACLQVTSDHSSHLGCQ